MKNEVAILIVSFNRKEFVLKNIEALNSLTYSKYDVLLFDNGSTDGTVEAVKARYPHVLIEISKENLGGAGGFAKGLEHTYTRGYKYTWCLDDDGYPSENALSILLEEVGKQKQPCIFGSKILGIQDGKIIDKHFWPLYGKYDRKTKKVDHYTEEEKKEFIAQKANVETTSVALLGMFIPRAVIEKIGYPKSELFVSNDDVEYCFRAWIHDIPVILVQRAVLYHPANKTAHINILSKKIEIIIMNPFKLYYYIRNNIYVTNKYLPVVNLVKLCFLFVFIILYTMFSNENKLATFKSGFLGFYHGFTKKLGKYNL